MIWSVDIEHRGRGSVSEHSLEALADALVEHAGVPDSDRGAWGVRLSVDANGAEDALARALQLVGQAAHEADLPGWPLARIEMQPEEELYAELKRPAVPPLVGVHEVAEILGVSHQRVSAMRRSGRLPAPFADLAAGPVWTRPTLNRFISSWRRVSGRRRAEAS